MGASVMSRLCSCRMRVCRSLRVCSAEPSSSGGSLTWAGSCCQPSAEEGEQSPVWLEGQGWRLQRSRADRPLLAVRAGGDARFDATDRNRVRDVGRIESNGSSARALGLEEAQELRQRIHAARAPSRGTVIRVKGSGLTIKPPKSASGRRTLELPAGWSTGSGPPTNGQAERLECGLHGADGWPAGPVEHPGGPSYGVRGGGLRLGHLARLPEDRRNADKQRAQPGRRPANSGTRRYR
jgi:hypothetical protein